MRSNASLFRSFDRIEDAMMRAAMPRTAASDPKVAPVHTARIAAARRALRDAAAAKPLTYTIAEVSNA